MTSAVPVIDGAAVDDGDDVDIGSLGVAETGDEPAEGSGTGRGPVERIAHTAPPQASAVTATSGHSQCCRRNPMTPTARPDTRARGAGTTGNVTATRRRHQRRRACAAGTSVDDRAGMPAASVATAWRAHRARR